MVIIIFLAILYVFISIIFTYVCEKHLTLDGDAIALILIFWPFVLLFMVIFNVLTSVVEKFVNRR